MTDTRDLTPADRACLRSALVNKHLDTDLAARLAFERSTPQTRAIVIDVREGLIRRGLLARSTLGGSRTTVITHARRAALAALDEAE